MHESLAMMVSTVLEIYGTALPVGLLIAATGALFGVFVVLKRVVFIGVTLSEAAACGIALGLLLGWPTFVGALLTAMLVVLLLGLPFERWLNLPRDTFLGVLFVAFSAGSVVLVAKSGFGLEKVKNLLFGSLLFASPHDLWLIMGVLLPCAAWLLVSIRPTVYAFLDPDAAQVLGIRVRAMEFAFFIALGAVVAAASKIAGVLLIFCYLVVAPGTALILYHRLAGVLALSVVVACSVTFGGILISYRFDLPPNQTIGLAHCLVFLLAMFTRTGLPGIRWRNGVPFTGLAAAACLLGLLAVPVDGQHPEESPQMPSLERGSSGNTVPAAPSQELSQSGWPELVERLGSAFRTRGRQAVPDAVAFLRKDPPLLFRAQIVAEIEHAIAASSGWQIRRPASDPVNGAAAEACLARAQQGSGGKP
ncbi:MAG TPA: metal ABC transporter permease [Candidatus Ozemobacteraceae bacterium]|nr:metal ABC transporter permease [Candidatus Ozemobacteraceae bacterium]